MSQFTRTIVTPSALSYNKTKEIISRANVKHVEYIANEHPVFPKNLDQQQRYEYIKQTLVITTRKSTPFITTFASPGKIVEDLGTILTLGWHCSFRCQFCYLIGSLYQRQWQEVYVNLDDLEKQIQYEKYVHRSILTIWSMLTFITKEPQLKIPDGLKTTADWLRKRFIQNEIGTDRKAKAFLRNNLDSIFAKLGIKDYSLTTLKRNIPHLYLSNSSFLPWLNVSEYTDFLAIDNITDFTSDLMRIMESDHDIRINLRTKSDNVSNLLSFNPSGRIKVAINFNTQYAIDNYELGTASLDSRIEAAKKIQRAKGFLLKIVVEPIMVYDGYENDYIDLIDRLKREIDLNKIVDISFGTVRYKTKLINTINRMIPNNTLNLEAESLINFPKDRIRYEESIRKNIYEKMIRKLKRFKNLTIRLAAETPEMWDQIGLNKEAHIAKSITQ